ncbi:MAG: class I SAM-dependent methyltransferase [Bacteroidales bacterium]|nr:class I SAM-dependent methyltransferase [Bacteroidales bacterium]MBO7321149.1 class I SAM-dependent methyltransferase [Bacteroidales bacterium]MBO7763939.1 class I SAM-dependent methyltransferase [Bacteroidales bacterium]
MDAKVLNSALEWVERQTHLCTKQARMLSNGDQGCLLQAFSLMVKPLHILELGAFTGYSTICLSRGLQEGGSIDTIEVYDELEDIIRGGFRRAGLIDVAGREDIAHLHIGDAKKIIPTLDKIYDIVYIDANKREYKEYYDLVFDKIRPGGYILADNVLWSGKVLLDNPPKDAQTQSIIAFNKMVAADPRVENTILPIRDGINVIYKL